MNFHRQISSLRGLASGNGRDRRLQRRDRDGIGNLPRERHHESVYCLGHGDSDGTGFNGRPGAGDDAALRHRLGGSRGEGAQTPQSLAGDDE